MIYIRKIKSKICNKNLLFVQNEISQIILLCMMYIGKTFKLLIINNLINLNYYKIKKSMKPRAQPISSHYSL